MEFLLNCKNFVLNIKNNQENQVTVFSNFSVHLRPEIKD